MVAALAVDLPLQCFDVVSIETVWCNLLANAVKNMPPDTQIQMAANTDQHFLQVNVSDQGGGEHGSAKPGVGLGLFICRAIIEAHEGTIRTLPAGCGAPFRFALPLGTPPLPPDDDADIDTEPLDAILNSPS